ncbi:MAG: peptidylprolyl isomerase [Anaerolineae bacterium]|nr:peptidylprolyl isomerase [Anaerolineae bacterium]
MNDIMTVQDGMMVSLAYTLHVDGVLVDESEQDEPLEFIQGQGDIISGLEQALYGMQVGQRREVHVAPEDGYGEVDEQAMMYVPLAMFPPNFPLQPGLELSIRDRENNILPARIVQVEEERALLDLNHPLAGKTLDFSVQIVALRPASDAERLQG